MADTNHVVEPVRVPFPNSYEGDPVVHISADTRVNAAVTHNERCKRGEKVRKVRSASLIENACRHLLSSCGGWADHGPPSTYRVVSISRGLFY